MKGHQNGRKDSSFWLRSRPGNKRRGALIPVLVNWDQKKRPMQIT